MTFAVTRSERSRERASRSQCGRCAAQAIEEAEPGPPTPETPDPACRRRAEKRSTTPACGGAPAFLTDTARLRLPRALGRAVGPAPRDRRASEGACGAPLTEQRAVVAATEALVSAAASSWSG